MRRELSIVHALIREERVYLLPYQKIEIDAVATTLLYLKVCEERRGAHCLENTPA